MLRLPAFACRGLPAQLALRVRYPTPASAAAARMLSRAPSSRIHVRCGYRMARAARAVARTSSSGSSYVVTKTSTVTPSGAGGGSPRSRRRHIVTPKRAVSTRLYVSASTSGTAIHQCDHATESSHRHAT
ncbi:Uncharacterised protein [Mycobacteroides abscessus]|nr:Uncharacterised protein [Mycobacteroides abscessus]